MNHDFLKEVTFFIISVFLIKCIEKCIPIVKVWIYDITCKCILVYYAHKDRCANKKGSIWILAPKIGLYFWLLCIAINVMQRILPE